MRLVLRAAETSADEVYVSLDEGPAQTEDAGILTALGCVSSDLLESLRATPLEGQPVKDVGNRLLTALKGHTGIDLALQNALADPKPCPIYIRLVTPAPAEFPWETLFDSGNKRFLALERRWPIARIADFGTPEKEVHYFAPPLRMLAVLSAVPYDAADEWRSLWSALSKSPLDFRLRVIVGQHSVKTEIDGLKDDRIRCELLESDEDLRRQIAEVRPHLLHFFCHGAVATSPMLILGTASDYAAERASIYLDPDFLRGLAPDAWLFTLNCCQGASDAEGVRSLASQLISAGYPAVVAMREPVSLDDANLFTRVFYGSLVPMLASEVVAGREIELELTTVLAEPRRALRNKHVPAQTPADAAAEHTEWTHPVLYLSSEPLKIRRVEREHERIELEMLHTMRLELHADTPPEAVARLDARIAELNERLGQQ
jgi:hypothetical protein